MLFLFRNVSCTSSTKILYTINMMFWSILLLSVFAVHGARVELDCEDSKHAIPAWISDHMLCKIWNDITYPFPNFNGRNCWSLGMDKWFHLTLHDLCNYLSMLWLKLIHVNKWDHSTMWCDVIWSLGMDKWFHSALYWACNYLSIVGLKSSSVFGKRAPDDSTTFIFWICSTHCFYWFPLQKWLSKIY